jgi:NADH pyrophosphatase NudC (nudix superfamily)
VFLGVLLGAPLFALAADHTEDLPTGMRWEDLRTLGAQLTHTDAALLGLARSLVRTAMGKKVANRESERLAIE